ALSSRLPGIGCGDGWVVRYLLPLLHRRNRGRLAARVKVDAGWTFGPQGALHLDPLRPDGTPGGCRRRGFCGSVLRAEPRPPHPRRAAMMINQRSRDLGHTGVNPGRGISSVVSHLPPEVEANPEDVVYSGSHRGGVLRAGDSSSLGPSRTGAQPPPGGGA